MTGPSPTLPPIHGVAADDPQARIGRQLALLERLAGIGLQVAEAVGREAEAAAGPPAADLALAYARVSRAVRLTVGLQSRLLKDLEGLDRAATSGRRERRRLVERIVGRVIRAEHDGGDAAGDEDEDEVERLTEEVAERLEHDDIYGDLAARPVGEVVAAICRDLGLSPDWARLSQEAWARDELEGGAGPPPPPVAGKGRRAAIRTSRPDTLPCRPNRWPGPSCRGSAPPAR